MRRWILGAALVLGACGSSADMSDNAGAPEVVRISLPDEPTVQVTGTGGALIERNCAACHSAEMIANQPPLTPEKWAATIDKMRTVYGAQIAKSEDAALIAALTAAQTPEPTPGTALPDPAPKS